MKQIATLPADADVGIQIGDDHLDIDAVVVWGDGGFGALRCHPNDLRDLLAAQESQNQLLESAGMSSDDVPSLFSS